MPPRRAPVNQVPLDQQNDGEDQQIPVAPTPVAPAPVVTFSDEQFAMLIQAMSRAPAPAPEPVLDRSGLTVEARFLAMLRKSSILTFDGKSMDPAAADAWIYQLEAGFEEINVPERLKSHCGAAMLKEGARYWWDSTARSIDRVDGIIPWETFKSKFFDKYYPKSYKYQMKKELMTLTQGSRSVAEYERDFDRLSRFAPEHVDTEAKKMEAFVMGLREDIQGFVEAHFPTTYASALSIALILDKGCNVRNQQPTSQGQSSGQKRKFEQLESQHNQDSAPRLIQGNQQHQNRSDQNQGHSYPQCRYCSKYHTGQCWKRTCFSCKKEGHIAAQCPSTATPLNQRPAPKALPPPPQKNP